MNQLAANEAQHLNQISDLREEIKNSEKEYHKIAKEASELRLKLSQSKTISIIDGETKTVKNDIEQQLTSTNQRVHFIYFSFEIKLNSCFKR